MPSTRRAPAFHAVLLAGGSGTRFWPLSRLHLPKQFLPLASRDPLIVATWRRALHLTKPDRIWVVAPAALAKDIRRALPSLRGRNLIVEPSPRDTAPAIGLACASVARLDPGAIVGFFPTDQVIRDIKAYRASVREAARAAATGALVCLGVRPTRPETGFGYLKCRRSPVGLEAVPVERFVEKPDRATAGRFLRSGRYLWNGGMFVWKASRFLEELGRMAPGTLAAVESTLRGRKSAWERAERRSVDYAVMERARGVQVVPLDAGWDDVGSWDAAARLREEVGLLDPHAILHESPHSAVVTSQRLVAIVGVPGVVVVDTPDALLVVARERSEQVRAVVEELRRRGRKDLL